MAYTDDQLKYVKEQLETEDYIMHDIFDDNDLIALLVRLEAAEACAGYLGSIAMDTTSKHLLDQWDKTKRSQ